MNATIINDCRDANAAGRQCVRLAGLLDCPVNFIGVANDLEAAGQLVDVLDAQEDRPGVVLVNVAPRGGVAKKWPNGTPFGYFNYRNVLVLISIDGHTLSLVKKLSLVQTIQVLDIPTAVTAMAQAGFITEEQGEHISSTQFRSYEFLPRAAAFLSHGGELPSETISLETVPTLTDTIWFVDNFGNCKTTILSSEIASQPGEIIKTALGELPFYYRLKDVPDVTAALVVGSSGIGFDRFIEVVVRGGNAASQLGLLSGSKVYTGFTISQEALK